MSGLKLGQRDILDLEKPVRCSLFRDKDGSFHSLLHALIFIYTEPAPRPRISIGDRGRSGLYGGRLLHLHQARFQAARHTGCQLPHLAPHGGFMAGATGSRPLCGGPDTRPQDAAHDAAVSTPVAGLHGRISRQVGRHHGRNAARALHCRCSTVKLPAMRGEHVRASFVRQGWKPFRCPNSRQPTGTVP